MRLSEFKAKMEELNPALAKDVEQLPKFEAVIKICRWYDVEPPVGTDDRRDSLDRIWSDIQANIS